MWCKGIACEEQMDRLFTEMLMRDILEMGHRGDAGGKSSAANEPARPDTSDSVLEFETSTWGRHILFHITRQHPHFTWWMQKQPKQRVKCPETGCRVYSRAVPEIGKKGKIFLRGRKKGEDDRHVVGDSKKTRITTVDMLKNTLAYVVKRYRNFLEGKEEEVTTEPATAPAVDKHGL